MDIKQSFAAALKLVRKTRKLTQEDFSSISSRTYVSTLERGLYTPTVEKVDSLAGTIGIHPLTLLCLTYMIKADLSNPETLLIKVGKELEEFQALISNQNLN